MAVHVPWHGACTFALCTMQNLCSRTVHESAPVLVPSVPEQEASNMYLTTCAMLLQNLSIPLGT
eukprot:12680690-Alexandrium_andersonii.AAC.1